MKKIFVLISSIVSFQLLLVGTIHAQQKQNQDSFGSKNTYPTPEPRLYRESDRTQKEFEQAVRRLQISTEPNGNIIQIPDQITKQCKPADQCSTNKKRYILIALLLDKDGEPTSILPLNNNFDAPRPLMIEALEEAYIIARQKHNALSLSERRKNIIYTFKFQYTDSSLTNPIQP
jgi:hypothetical protein